MPTISGFLKLENRYVITGTLKPAAALHIGSGTVNAKTDAPFFSDHLGPLIPGSTLRGVLRSRLERILQGVGGNRGCVLFTTETDNTHTKCFTVNEGLLKIEATCSIWDSAFGLSLSEFVSKLTTTSIFDDIGAYWFNVCEA